MFLKLKQRMLLLQSERGAAYVEYAVLAGLAVLVILGSVQFFFGGIAVLFQRLGEMLRAIG